MLELTTRLFAALLVLFPNIPNPYRSCMMLRRDDIVRVAADGAVATGVPPSIILMVGFLESHFGCNPRSGGSWGSPIDARHRHTAGSPMRMANDLATSYRVCDTWYGAVSRFRCGGPCVCRARMSPSWYSPAYLMNRVDRIETLAREADHGSD